MLSNRRLINGFERLFFAKNMFIVSHKCFSVFNLCVSRFIYSVSSRSDPDYFIWWR